LRLALDAADGTAQQTRQIAVLAVAHGRLALWRSGAALELPLEPGGGEETCRRAMRRLFGSVEGETRLIGVVRAADRRPAVEVWLVRRLRRDLTAARQAPDQFVNALLSTLEFNVRVLELAEDPRVPLLARLRFLAIFSTNLDQFFMVDVGALQHQVAAGVVERSPDGLTPAE